MRHPQIARGTSSREAPLARAPIRPGAPDAVQAERTGPRSPAPVPPRVAQVWMVHALAGCPQPVTMTRPLCPA
jgi:hypothetical protein